MVLQVPPPVTGTEPGKNQSDRTRTDQCRGPPQEPGPTQGFSLVRDSFTATVRGSLSFREAPGDHRQGEGDSPDQALRFTRNKPVLLPSLPPAVSNL